MDGFGGTQRRAIWWDLGLALLLWSALPETVRGAEVLNTSAVRKENRFVLHAETSVRVSVPEVRRIFTDYRNLPRLNSDIKRVEVLERRDDGTVRLGVASDFCILAVCLNFAWVQEVTARPDGDIGIAILPDGGDFREGHGRWRLQSDGEGTRLIFDIDLTPNFWIPPLFGAWLMRQKMAEEALETAQSLERIASPRLEPPGGRTMGIESK